MGQINDNIKNSYVEESGEILQQTNVVGPPWVPFNGNINDAKNSYTGDALNIIA